MHYSSLCKREPDWRISLKPNRIDQLTLTADISVSYLPTSGPFMQTRSHIQIPILNRICIKGIISSSK